ncbi:MAG: glycerophosphoryl diester phosphodiesterase membrane domain-containing protein [Limisphaerales bacterium]
MKSRGFLFSVVLALVVGPLMGGFYFLLLQVIRRQPANVGDVFCGFQRAFKQLFLGHLVVALIVSACLLPFNLMFASKAAPLLEQMRHTAPADMESIFSQFGSAFVGTLPIFLICMIPVTYLSVSWQFTLPLIIDKGMTFGTAMKTSWKMVGKHWWQVFGLTIVIGLLNVVGFCVCCVGLLFTVPIGFVAMMFAYETIFSETAT